MVIFGQKMAEMAKMSGIGSIRLIFLDSAQYSSPDKIFKLSAAEMLIKGPYLLDYIMQMVTLDQSGQKWPNESKNVNSMDESDPSDIIKHFYVDVWSQ